MWWWVAGTRGRRSAGPEGRGPPPQPPQHPGVAGSGARPAPCRGAAPGWGSAPAPAPAAQTALPGPLSECRRHRRSRRARRSEGSRSCHRPLVVGAPLQRQVGPLGLRNWAGGAPQTRAVPASGAAAAGHHTGPAAPPQALRSPAARPVAARPAGPAGRALPRLAGQTLRPWDEGRLAQGAAPRTDLADREVSRPVACQGARAASYPVLPWARCPAAPRTAAAAAAAGQAGARSPAGPRAAAARRSPAVVRQGALAVAAAAAAAAAGRTPAGDEAAVRNPLRRTPAAVGHLVPMAWLLRSPGEAAACLAAPHHWPWGRHQAPSAASDPARRRAGGRRTHRRGVLPVADPARWSPATAAARCPGVVVHLRTIHWRRILLSLVPQESQVPCLAALRPAACQEAPHSWPPSVERPAAAAAPVVASLRAACRSPEGGIDRQEGQAAGRTLDPHADVCWLEICLDLSRL
mmetsp:Transcript_8050/g.23853  ORF Transcript_8050/g.23853 Transcript_8050/m.23853 type:complete len:464 (+) Transcript_8050:2252-3643(+)